MRNADRTDVFAFLANLPAAQAEILLHNLE